jgi:hypothetical protein
MIRILPGYVFVDFIVETSIMPREAALSGFF